MVSHSFPGGAAQALIPAGPAYFAAYTNREIAEALGTAEGTVKIHVSNILAKLGARDRTQAVLRALEGRVL
jgi:FixJ family two-component response regulator